MNENEKSYEYDVIIVGASVAGNTAAILFAREGLRVALIERNHDLEAFKKACTHFIQPFALPVLKRLGIVAELEAVGAVPNGGYAWTRYGWTGSGVNPKAHGYNLRRERFDPILRRKALETPGVDLFLGTAVRELILERGRFVGLRANGPDHQTMTFRGKLVVGADGRYSRTAHLAEIDTRSYENDRFMYYAYYQNMTLKSGQATQVWYLGEDAAYAMPNDNGYTLLAVMPAKTKLDAFKKDIEGHFNQIFQHLPDGPDLQTAQRASEFMGMLNLPILVRQPTLLGLALVGDAALAPDPLWGNGMGWALQGATWLVGKTAQALRSGDQTAVDAALAAYQAKHYQTLGGRIIREVDFAQARPFNWLERLFYEAAVHDKRFEKYTGPHSARLANRDQWPPRHIIWQAMKVNAAARLHLPGRRPADATWQPALAD